MTRAISSSQLFIGEMQLGKTAFVIKRDCRAIGYGLREIVDRDVITEDLAGAFLLPCDQRGSGEADEGRIRQSGAHVGREDVVLAAMRLVGDDDDVAAGRKHGINLAARRPEFLDQREDVSLIASQQFFQMVAAPRLNFLALLGQFVPQAENVPAIWSSSSCAISDDQECPVAWLLAQNLAGEEQHRQALARALRVPENSEPPSVLLDLVHRRNGAVHAEELVGFPKLLDEAVFVLLKRDEILDDVEKPRRAACALDQRIETDDAGFLFLVDPLPFVKVFQRRMWRANTASRPLERMTKALGVKTCGMVAR